ncbi:MAG: hypothetical protein JO069_03485 [Verrucomicrobia bacterium]|nr:hypothetical protein [Verrucomicrobiota bacterium]
MVDKRLIIDGRSLIMDGKEVSRFAMRLLSNVRLPAAFTAILGALWLAGCSTIDSRIQKDPAAFGALSPSDQALVRSGRIREGFPQPAVYLAWGRPDQVRQGARQGHPYEAWVYLQARTVYSGFYGPRFTRFGLYRYWGYWPGYSFYGPFADPFYDDFVTVYVPYRSAFFENGRCTGWEYVSY